MPDADGTRVQYQGDTWVAVGGWPRLIAESYRRLLGEHGVVSVIRTPFQWVTYTPVIEIETGGYMGDVTLYVPEVQHQRAAALLEGDDA
ncbi:hypothetical protein [Deinococcus maricopensis]|uniref:DUF2007 domain-containing protein n=1 Tax=Deinococcus maricopensis (strain DSM 21211 / LMG 22137 / NRRL B-23946 / LB-34) TaxID=709986 RepID=E8U3J0_DEIML|nr:hypothetical protein [Deinococcus maricopensis]ADV68614.1 hypothetical protein Deima_2985 [Deinococcus maricopensis DSM 21211]